MAGFAAEFADITKPNEPLAPFTFLRVGGPAEYLVQPRGKFALSRADDAAGHVYQAAAVGIQNPETGALRPGVYSQHANDA